MDGLSESYLSMSYLFYLFLHLFWLILILHVPVHGVNFICFFLLANFDCSQRVFGDLVMYVRVGGQVTILTRHVHQPLQHVTCPTCPASRVTCRVTSSCPRDDQSATDCWAAAAAADGKFELHGAAAAAVTPACTRHRAATARIHFSERKLKQIIQFSLLLVELALFLQLHILQYSLHFSPLHCSLSDSACLSRLSRHITDNHIYTYHLSINPSISIYQSANYVQMRLKRKYWQGWSCILLWSSYSSRRDRNI